MWVTLNDGTQGYVVCSTFEQGKRDVERVTGKKVVKMQVIPYPAGPVLYDGGQPVYTLCYTPSQCAGHSYCPKRRVCTE